jgi:hypothetical protein
VSNHRKIGKAQANAFWKTKAATEPKHWEQCHAWNPDQPRARSSHTTGQAEDNWGRTSSGREAPIGHRQPRAKDVPSAAEDNLGVLSPEDQAIDRKLRICRDC